VNDFTIPGYPLSRKQAVMLNAIPQQMLFLTQQELTPTWEVWITTEGWKQTAENLQLTKKEKEQYQEFWNHILNNMIDASSNIFKGGH
jgi:hypothetical protein